MEFELTSFILGIVAGGVVAGAFAVPRVGRTLAGMVAVVMVTGGVGFLAWAVSSVSSQEQLKPISWGQLYISSPPEAFGAGGGLLVGGMLALFLSLRGVRRRNSAYSDGPPPLRR